MTFQHHETSSGQPLRPDHARPRRRVTVEAECLQLIGLRRNIDRCLNVLLTAIDPELPLSGLVQAAPGVLLFKGGRNAS